MKMRMVRLRNKFLILILFPVLIQAQSTHRYILNQTSVNGWYRLPLSPEMRKHMQIQMHDIRLYCNGDTLHPVSYSLQKQESLSPVMEFENLTWRYVSGNTKSVIITEKGFPHNSFLLKLGNHDIERSYTLSGSYDLKKWFAIAEDQKLMPGNGPQGFYWEQFNYPLVDYKFLKIDFTDSNEALNIDAAVIHKKKNKELNLNLLKDLRFLITEVPSKKITRICISSEYPQVINKLNIQVKEPALYQRKARLYVSRKDGERSRKEEITELLLSAALPNSYELNLLLDDTLIMEIENDDNSPLKIGGIICMQNPVVLLTYLKAACSPVLECGDKSLSAPQYDLGYFTDKVNTDTVHELSVKSVQLLKASPKAPAPAVEKPFWQTEWFIWICLLSGGLCVFYFAVKLLGSKPEKD